MARQTAEVTSVAVIGSLSMGTDQCNDLAVSLLDTLSQAWPLKKIFTLKEDPMGKAIRREAAHRGLIRLGTSIAEQPYEDAEAVAAARIIWRVPRVIVYWDGAKKGLSTESLEICLRMKKPFKVFEV